MLKLSRTWMLRFTPLALILSSWTPRYWLVQCVVICALWMILHGTFSSPCGYVLEIWILTWKCQGKCFLANNFSPCDKVLMMLINTISILFKCNREIMIKCFRSSAFVWYCLRLICVEHRCLGWWCSWSKLQMMTCFCCYILEVYYGCTRNVVLWK